MSNPQKMKIGKYISISINTILWFVACWILNSIAQKNGTLWVQYALTIVSTAIAILSFSSITLHVLGSSIIGFCKSFRFSYERGLWKILTFIFRIGMLVFAGLIVIFWIIWLTHILQDAVFTSFSPIEVWAEKIYSHSMAYISGITFAYEGITLMPYHLFITSFVFILIWVIAGFAFEILKRVLGGYKKPQSN